jgi:hypothetical protein
MPTLHAVSLSLGAVGLAGCTSAATSASMTSTTDIEIRHSGGAVTGNLFQCTGTWPSDLTPCGYSWGSQPTTIAAKAGADAVELRLLRTPIPVDGGASIVSLDLEFAPAGLVAVTAHEATTSAGTVRQIEASDAIGGWVDPVVTGPTPDARNAGRLSLTFPWGSISGTYDTAPNQGP